VLDGFAGVAGFSSGRGFHIQVSPVFPSFDSQHHSHPTVLEGTQVILELVTTLYCGCRNRQRTFYPGYQAPQLAKVLPVHGAWECRNTGMASWGN